MMLSNFFTKDFLSSQGVNDTNVVDICIDNRNVVPGSIFVAIKGVKHDGHDFVAAAIESGAIIVVVSKDMGYENLQIKVDDTTKALGEMANCFKKSRSCNVIAVTGSCGKTSTKNILAAILQQQDSTLASAGNLNNLYGLPLSMFRLTTEHKYAVFELGASVRGEIKKLTNILQPDVALITNAGESHQSGMGGNVAAVAAEKGEIFSTLTNEGVAVLNCDSPFFNYWLNLISGKKWLGFTLDKTKHLEYNNLASLYGGFVFLADNINTSKLCSSFDIISKKFSYTIKTKLLGKHNVSNILAAVVIASYYGVEHSLIIKAVAALTNSSRRNVMHEFDDICLIDDSYNANPQSFTAAINTLSLLTGSKVLVMGDMAELGEESISLHKKISVYAKQSGIDMLLCFGEHSSYAASSFGEGSYCFNSHQDIYNFIISQLNDKVNILVKGSRSMSMDKVVDKLLCFLEEKSVV